MSPLKTALSEYLATRRAPGFKLRAVGRRLEQFVLFAETAGTGFITTELALEWAMHSAHASAAHRARQLGIVCQFAQYCSALDARTEIPPPDLLPYRYTRRPPHLYTDAEITGLLQAARRLASPTGLRAMTYATLFGLLAVTGMRVAEPIALDRADVDLCGGSLTIRGGKFGKSRWLPLHRSTRHALQRYATRRDRLHPAPLTPSFFLSEHGHRLTDCSVRATFVKLSYRIGLRAPQDHSGPRLHDLRHGFAIRTLLHWYRAGVDVNQRLPQLATYLGHAHVSDTYWYLSASPELLQPAAQRLAPFPEAEGGYMNTNDANIPRLLQAFFTDRLMRQRQVSPHTIASYRDTFCLLLRFVQKHTRKAPATLSLHDLDAPLIGAFLDHLERERGISPRSRNVRLAAVHSFFRYVALHEPASSAQCQRILAIPGKRYARAPLEFLTRAEIEALLAAPDLTTWFGRRDRTLLLLAVQTGLRVSELIGLRCHDVALGPGAHVRCLGKGRKTRCTPLRRDAVVALRQWLRERQGQPTDPLFPSQRGGPLSRDSVEHLLHKHAAQAARHCPSLMRKTVTPHVLRHSTAMELLQHGVDCAVIALWLGHESLETTQAYLHASLEIKERALEKTSPLGLPPSRYRPDDRLLAFLISLCLCRMQCLAKPEHHLAVASRSA